MKLQNLSLHIALFTVMISGPLMGAWHVPVIFGLMLLSLFALGLHSLHRVQTGHPLQTNWLVILPVISVVFTISMIVPIPTQLHAILSADSSADLQKAYGLLGQHPKTLLLSLAPQETAARLMQLLTALALFLVISDQIRHRRVQKLVGNWILAGAILFLLVSLDHQPLANHNQVARIFGIFSLLCAMEYLESEKSIRHYTYGIVAVLSGAAIYTLPSRWGMISFALCLLFFLRSWLLGLGVLALGLFVGSGLIWDRMSTLAHPETYFGKIELFKQLPSLLQRHWLMGIGQGALSVEFHKNVLPDFNANPLFSYYYMITHLENTTLQTLIDHGLIKGLILWGLSIWAFILVAKAKPHLAPLFLFVWIGDFSDFVFESGTGLYLCTLALTLCPIDLKLKVSPHRLAGIFGGTLATATLASLILFVRSPVNYLNPIHAYSQPKTEAWLNYALTRRPTLYQAHILLARIYWGRQNYVQALSEYREAAAANPGILASLLKEVAPIARTFEERKKILPVINPESLSILCEEFQSKRCFQEAHNWTRWLEIALAEKNPREALAALQALTNGKPPDGKAASWFAQILTLQNGLEATLAETTGWQQDLREPCPFAIWRLETLSGASKPEQALKELDDIKDCLDNWEIKKADLYNQNAQPAKALEIIQSLLRINPTDPVLLSKKEYLAKQLATLRPSAAQQFDYKTSP